MKEKVLVGFSLVGGFIASALGGFDTMIFTFLTVMTIDYLFGSLSALVQARFNWYVGAKGITRKIALLVIVALGQQLDIALQTEQLIRNSVLFFYIANDLLSVVNHMVDLEIPVPPILRRIVEVFEDKSEDETQP